MPKVQLKAGVFVSALSMLLIPVAFGQNNSNSSMSNTSTTNSSSSLSSQDKQFLDHLAKDSEGEVQVAQMVESKTSNPKVKEFAQRIIHDHMLLDQQVKAVMSKHGMQPPPPLTAEQQQLQSKLQNESGEKLDRTYMQAEVKGHQKAIREVSQFSQKAGNLQPAHPDVVEVAEEARPVLEQHLDFAQRISGELGKAK